MKKIKKDKRETNNGAKLPLVKISLIILGRKTKIYSDREKYPKGFLERSPKFSLNCR